jgi:hypothetical protein
MATAYSLAAYIGAQTDFLARVNAGAGDSTIKIKDADGVTLAECVIDEAASAVSETTGVLTIAIATQEDAATGGTAAVAHVCDGDGVAHAELPCAAGTVAVPDTCVVNSLSVIEGQTFDILSTTFGVGPIIGA